MKKILSVLVAFAIGVSITYLAPNYLNPTPDYLIPGDYSEILANDKTEILLFTASACPVCKDTKEMFKAENIIFVERVIDLVEEDMALFETLTKTGAVPLMVLKDKAISGYDKAIYLSAIKG
jgi:glutaredoxin